MENKVTKKSTKEIIIRPQVRFGKPTVGNTRITIADVLNLLKAGYTVQNIPEQYPSVTIKGIEAALEYTANILGKEEILTISNDIQGFS